MKKLVHLIRISIFLTLVSCDGNAQVDLAKVTPVQWQEDLDFLVKRINKSFAGFTPETKEKFTSQAAKLRVDIAGMTTNQRILAMVKLLALLNDGHTELSMTGTASGFHRLPLVLYYFGEDLHVVAAGKQFSEIVGSKLTKIDGQPVKEAFEKLKPYMNYDNDIEFITTAPYLFVIPEVLSGAGISKDPNEVTLTFANDAGLEKDQFFKAIPISEYVKVDLVRAYQKTPLYLENPAKDYWYRFLPESKVMYVSIKYMVNQDGEISLKKMISEVFSEIDKTSPDKLVVDVRLCRGGNYYNALPIIDEVKKRPQLNKAGKFFVINSRLTFSAAAVTTIYMKDQTNAIIVGEVSRARPNWSENMESYYLPNTQLKFDCTDELKFRSERLRDKDKIPVDVPINRSFNRYKAGEDEVMDYILSLY